MTATAKKILSVFLAFTLVFAFTPTVAMGEGDAASDKPAENPSDIPAPDTNENGVTDLKPATIVMAENPEALSQEGQEGQLEAQDAEGGTDSAMTAQADVHYYQAEGYKLGYVDYTYTPEGSESAVAGVVVTDINIDSAAHPDVVIPETVEDDSVTRKVVGVGSVEGRSFTFSWAGNVNKFTFPSSLQFIKDISFTSNVNDEVVFKSSAGDNENPLASLPEELFKGFRGSTVTLPNRLAAIPSRLFKESNITSITLPVSVKQINLNAFTDTKKLATVTLNEGLEIIGQEAFAPTLNNGIYGEASSSFTSIAIPSTVREIQQEAFRKDTALATVDFGSASGLQTIGDYAFYGTSLTNVSIPDSVQTIGKGAFSGKNYRNTMGGDLNPNSQGAYTLTSVSLGSGLTTLGSGAFAYQPITSVAIPENLTTLGYDTSTYQFVDQYGVYHLSGAIGAFSMCDKLQTVTWPTSSSLTTVGGFDGCTSLTADAVNSLPASVKRIDDYAFYNCTSMDNVMVPSTVQEIGKGAFSKHDSTASGKTFTLLNKNATLEGWTSADPTTGPWPLGCGYTIKYPRSAAADSSIVQYRNAVEAYEAAQSIAEANRTKFETVADDFYTVTGSVPAGATVTLIAGDKEYHPELDAANSFTSELIEGGTYVGAVVSLQGYADYRVYPGSDAATDKTKTVGVLNNDWTFGVTTDMMTLASQLGILQVRTTGNYNEDANVAVFDHATGKLVSQGHVMRARVYVVDDIPAGIYDVVAWQKNDYFSRVSSLADFAAMGFTSADYALAEGVAVAALQTKEIELAVPQLDTSKITGVLATGEVIIPSLYNPPEVPFVATVRYDMTTGQSVDSVQVSVPEGLEPLAAATNAKEYFSVAGNVNASSWDAKTRTLTISGLDAADQQSSTMAVSLKATKPGSYAISAALESGGVKAPIGAASVECPAIQLVVPQGTLQSREFTVHVYAAPNSDIELKIGDTVLGVDKKTLDAACKTNFVGHAKVKVTIPDDEISVSPYYQVTATLKSGGEGADKPSDTAIVQYNAALSDIPFEPTVRDFWFESAGDQIWLAKEGEDLSGGYYIVGVHENNFTRQMPFTVVIDSLQPLEDTTTLYLGMLDNSVVTYTMSLSETTDLKSGAKRYTFKTIVPITEDDKFLSRNLPCRFDVMPDFKLTSTVRPEFSATDMGTLKLAVNNEADRLSKLGADGFNSWYNSMNETGKKCVSGEYFYTSKLGTDYGYKYYSQDLVNAGYDYVFGVFNESFRHEKWDPTGVVWKQLTDAEKARFEQAENQVAAAYDALALLLGDSKPMYEYASYEAYLEAELGYMTGGAYDKASLTGEGYLVIDDLFDGTWGAVSVEVPDDGRVLPTQQDIAMTTASTTADDGRIGSFQTKNGKGEAANKRVNGKTDVDIALDTIEDSTGFVMDIVRANAPEASELIDGFAVRAAGLARSVYEPVDDEIKSRSDYTGIDSELANRKAELERMEAMNKYYDSYNPGSMCQRALQAEIDYMKQYIADLEWAKRFAWYGEVGTVAGGAAIEFSDKVGELADAFVESQEGDQAAGILAGVVAGLFEKAKTAGVAARQAWGVQAALPSTLLAPDLAKHRAQVQQWRFYRERECKKDDFGKLHYNKKPILDPSGYTYEGVEDNRVSDVIATIYQMQADGSWAVWNAAEADQVNPQNTTSTGLFAWDVPEGDWKVLFQKAGYDDVWSQVMHVLPEWTNVAINMLRADPPKGTSSAVNADDPESPYVDITFDQYMKASADFAPTVTVDGTLVTNATWVSMVAGTDKAGNEVPLSLTLRVPLAGLVEPSDTATVTVADAYSYAGKQMAAPYSATVTVPDNATYYYVAPDEVATYTKGSNKALKFTFKRSSYDNRTFDRFEGILMDGTAVDASNYKAEAGSAVITLSASYLETLAEGDHVLAAQFADGSATAPLKVAAAETKGVSAKKTKTPATGDRTAPMGGLLIAAFVACGVMLLSRRQMSAAKVVTGKHVRR